MDPRARFDSDDTTWLNAPDAKVEGTWIERKESFQTSDIAKAISAFANGQPQGGLIIVGVKKDGNITGINLKRPAVEQGLNELADHIDSTDWKHRFVPLESRSDQILYIFVPYSGDRVVCLSDGRAFRRMGSSTRELNRNEIDELRQARGEVFFELEPTPELAAAPAIDAELAQMFLDEMRRRDGLTLERPLPVALRDRLLAVSGPRGDVLTVAGLLSIGQRPSDFLGGARLRFLRFEGVEERFGGERNVIKDLWFDGAIPRLVAAFRDFMRSQVREFDYLGPDAKFIREPEYPEFAWEEAVINALVHRSYSLKNAAVFVRMFDDRLEVESPGGFPGTVRPDNLYSFPRNPKLANALQYLQLVRLAQEGTRRMQQEMEKLGLPPPILDQIQDSRVRVTLKNDIERRRARLNPAEPARQRIAANPGGTLSPHEVIGRDAFIANLWRVLARRSVILGGERRLGKTAVLYKMTAEPVPGWLPIYASCEVVASEMDFALTMAKAIEARLDPKLREAPPKPGFWNKYTDWRSLLLDRVEALMAQAEKTHAMCILFLDEVAIALQSIERAPGSGSQQMQTLLGILRDLRQEHPSLRMLLTGSVGIYEVIDRVRKAGDRSDPVSDLTIVDLPPLSSTESELLVRRLLQDERILTVDDKATIAAIQDASSGIPYVIHHIVDQLAWRSGPTSPEVVSEIVQQALVDVRDPWGMKRYDQRLNSHAGNPVLARNLLDLIAQLEPVEFRSLNSRIPTSATEEIRAILTRLQRDDYLILQPDGRYRFRFPLVKRYWRLHRDIPEAKLV